MGLMSKLAPDVFPPPSHWHETDMPDQSGKCFLVTGGNSGIGFRTIEVLLQHNAKVYMGARSAEKANAAIERLKKSARGKGSVHFLQVDLGDLDSVRAAAREFLSKESQLDVLVNNGGIMHPPAGSKTASGYETQWGTNVLGPWLLTQELLPALEAAASAKGSSRIVEIASLAHRYAPKEGIRFDVLQTGTSDEGKDTIPGSWQYAQSKLANVLLARMNDQKYRSKDILCLALHPGIIRSPLWDNSRSLPAKFNYNLVAIDIPRGALTQLWAATSPELTLERDGGAFLMPLCRRAKPMHPRATDVELGQEVWDWCEKAVAGSTAKA